MSMNEIDPVLLQQAHLLGGGQRQPTKAEQLEMIKGQVMMAHLSVAGTALSSHLEAGGAPDLQSVDFVNEVAQSILDTSEKGRDDFGANIALRKVRNQLAAQLVYSMIRGLTTCPSATTIVDKAFKMATALTTHADEFATKEMENEGVDSSTVKLTP